MYYRHFGLSGAPFQFTPSPKLLFMSKAHRETLAALEWALLHEPGGFTLLIGETGTGKTTLIVSLLARSYERVRTAYVSNPKLGFDGLLRDIARQLGIPPQAERLEMFGAFDRYLAGLGEGERAVVIVDEAQALSDEMLEDLRLFSNRERGEDQRLHFVFAGQPGLLTRLMAPGLRQVNERIGTRALLNPLEAAEARAYVEYRLAAYGGSAEAVFGRGTVDHMLARSGGNPRRINVLCHNALLRAYHAGEPMVSLESARAAVLEIENLFSRARQYDSESEAPAFMPRNFAAVMSMTRGLRPAIVAATLAIAGMGSLYFWNSGAPRREEPVSSDAASTVGDAVIEYPGGAGNSQLSFASNRSAASAAANGSPEASARPQQDRPEQQKVRVQSGDTLDTIARAYLGSRDEMHRLIKANPQIGNINHIYPGEMLNLPAPDGSPHGAVSAPAHETAASDWRRVTPGADGFQTNEE